MSSTLAPCPSGFCCDAKFCSEVLVMKDRGISGSHTHSRSCPEDVQSSSCPEGDLDIEHRLCPYFQGKELPPPEGSHGLSWEVSFQDNQGSKASTSFTQRLHCHRFPKMVPHAVGTYTLLCPEAILCLTIA